jgi:hypothetical protein
MDGGATFPRSPLPPNRHASLHEPRRARLSRADLLTSRPASEVLLPRLLIVGGAVQPQSEKQG